MKSNYNSIEEWQIDMSLFRQNNNDTSFLTSIVSKINNSPLELRNEIEDIVQGEMMIKDPLRFFRLFMGRHLEDKILLTKSENDPWYGV